MRPFLLVAPAAAFGATGRWAVGELITREPGRFPWATLLVNLVGCALAGLAARSLVPGSDRWLTVVTGVLGGLTTFSTFSVETREMVAAGQAGRALAYVASSVIGGMAAVEIARGDWRRR